MKSLPLASLRKQEQGSRLTGEVEELRAQCRQLASNAVRIDKQQQPLQQAQQSNAERPTQPRGKSCNFWRAP